MSLILTDVGSAKLTQAFGGIRTPVKIIKFSTGYTAGSVDSTATSVPSENYGPVDIASVSFIDDDQVQFECPVPETVGGFDINVIGLWDDEDDLVAIGKMSTTYPKVAENLPTELGNAFNFREQLLISSAAAALDFTLNDEDQNNLPYADNASNLSDKAILGVFKTYRVVAMPDSYSDVATTNGTVWSFGRYANELYGVTGAGAGSSNKIKGDSTYKFKSYHVGSIIQIYSGALASKLRWVTSVDESGNEATLNSGLGGNVGSGVSFIIHSLLNKVSPTGSIPYASNTGRLISDSTKFFYNDTDHQLIVGSNQSILGVGTPGTSLVANWIIGIEKSVNNQFDYPMLIIHKSRGTTGSPLALQNNDLLGSIYFTAYSVGGVAEIQSWYTGSGVNRRGKLVFTVYDTLAKNALELTSEGILITGDLNSAAIIPTALQGDIVLPNNRSIRALKSDASSTVKLLTLNTFNQLELGTVVSQFLLASAPTLDLHPATKKYVDDRGFKVGDIKMFGGTVLEDNWMWCDFGAISRTTFSELYGVIGIQFGIGDGSTTFNKPDFRNRSPMGPGLGDSPFATNYNLGMKQGEMKHVQTLAELATHRHSTTGASGGAGMGGSGGPNNLFTDYAGGNQAMSLLHPVTVVNFVIKYRM